MKEWWGRGVGREGRIDLRLREVIPLKMAKSHKS